MTANGSYSRLSYMALIPEVTENIALKPTTFVPILSESIVPEYQPMTAMPVQGTRVKNMRPVPSAIPAPTGSINILVEPKTFGHFLKGIMGSVVSGVLLPISSASGAFAVGETITGGTSSETAVVLAVSLEDNYLLVGTVSGAFQDGETITGGTSSETATLGTYVATRYGHEAKSPQNSLPTYTVEFGYADSAIRYSGLTFDKLNSIGQSDNIITAEIGVTARCQFQNAQVTLAVASGSGAKTIKLDQTTGLAVGDTIKVWRKGTGYLDFVSAGVKTHTIASIVDENTITVTNLETSLTTADKLVLAPQTPSYSISKEFYWIGGSEAKLADTALALVSASANCIEDFKMAIMNDIEARHCANGFNIANRFPSKNILKGVEATASLTKTYQDIELLDVVRANKAQAYSIKHRGQKIGSSAEYETLEFILPNVQFSNFNPNISEDAVLEQQVEMVAYDNGGEYFMKGLLVNDVTSY